jgi:hypothetical protein
VGRPHVGVHVELGPDSEVVVVQLLDPRLDVRHRDGTGNVVPQKHRHSARSHSSRHLVQDLPPELDEAIGGDGVGDGRSAHSGDGHVFILPPSAEGNAEEPAFRMRRGHR